MPQRVLIMNLCHGIVYSSFSLPDIPRVQPFSKNHVYYDTDVDPNVSIFSTFSMISQPWQRYALSLFLIEGNNYKTVIKYVCVLRLNYNSPLLFINFQCYMAPQISVVKICFVLCNAITISNVTLYMILLPVTIRG